MTFKPFAASLLASALLAGLGMSPAMAQQGGGSYAPGTQTPGIDRTQQAISARIQQGLASGHITPYEAQLLYRRDRDIEMRESRFKANGNATPQERQQLRADLAALNAEVERLMSDRDVARQPGYGTSQPGHDASTPGIDNRQWQIGQRIEEGVRSGRITQREARRLQRQAREIERREAYFKSDGVVTQQERRQLRSELEALQAEVERMMRNERNENDRRGRS